MAHNTALAESAEVMTRESVQKELMELIDRDLKRRRINISDPLPHAPVGEVLPDLLPITGNVLIPLGRTLSRFGTFVRLLKPGL